MSPETPDGALLRLYVKQRSEAAFGLLVRRHLGLVYAACLREVGDAALAEDAALSVFLVLARRAPSLRGGTGLAGWLFQTARLAARNARRAEGRRRGHEREAVQVMQHEQEASEADVWEAVTPRLNDALASLGAPDRECVLLRFFEGRSLAEVGARLGVSENTARMRVARAVEKMRRCLDAGGVVLAAPALAALLLEQAQSPAPDSCAAAALSLPLPGAAVLSLGPAGVRAAQLAQGVLHIMAIKTLATVAVSAVVVLSLTGGGFALEKRHRQQVAQQQEKVQMAYTKLPMAHGRDIRRPMRGLDEMNDIFVKRFLQENANSTRLHLPNAERIRRNDAVFKAGQAEIGRVVASQFVATFDPSVMDKAAREASR